MTARPPKQNASVCFVALGRRLPVGRPLRIKREPFARRCQGGAYRNVICPVHFHTRYFLHTYGRRMSEAQLTVDVPKPFSAQATRTGFQRDARRHGGTTTPACSDSWPGYQWRDVQFNTNSRNAFTVQERCSACRPLSRLWATRQLAVSLPQLWPHVRPLLPSSGSSVASYGRFPGKHTTSWQVHAQVPSVRF